jgi:hypothetical protein
MRVRTILAAAAAPAALAATLLGTSQPAHAWPLDHTVTLKGQLTGCAGQFGPQAADVRANLNNEIVTQHEQSGAPPTYSVTWHNVPNGDGGWAFITVHCYVTADYNRWVHVYQPKIGETLQVNL